MSGGSENFNKNFNNAMRRMRKGAITGLKLSLAVIKRESQSRTPVDEGNLKGGHYTAMQVNKNHAVGEVGTVADYAVYVHEDMEANHPVGEAKFLENAITAKAKTVKALIYKHTRL